MHWIEQSKQQCLHLDKKTHSCAERSTVMYLSNYAFTRQFSSSSINEDLFFAVPFTPRLVFNSLSSGTVISLS